MMIYEMFKGVQVFQGSERGKSRLGVVRRTRENSNPKELNC